MELMDAIAQRRSVREFTDEPVDQPTARLLIAAAVQAPNAVNTQPWSFVVVTDKSLLDRIARDAKSHMLAALPPGALSAHFRERLSDPEFHIFYHAPALIVISAPSAEQWVVEDCALAAENLMLSAHGRGLGSCWIGFAQSWLGTPAGKQALTLSAEFLPVAPIVVGHPRRQPPLVPRKDPHIHWIG